MEENEDIKKAVEELEKIRENEQDRRLAELRLKHILDQNSIRKSGYREGIKEGKKEGIKEAKKEIAKNLMDLKIPIEQIIQITGLTEDEIKDIQ